MIDAEVGGFRTESKSHKLQQQVCGGTVLNKLVVYKPATRRHWDGFTRFVSDCIKACSHGSDSPPGACDLVNLLTKVLGQLSRKFSQILIVVTFVVSKSHTSGGELDRA